MAQIRHVCALLLSVIKQNETACFDYQYHSQNFSFSRSNHDLWICSITSRWNEAGLRQTKNPFFTSRVSNIHWEKSVRIWSLSVLYFPAFGLNTERYLISFRIQSKCGKIRTRKLQIRTLFTQWLIYTIKKKLSHFDKF